MYESPRIDADEARLSDLQKLLHEVNSEQALSVEQERRQSVARQLPPTAFGLPTSALASAAAAIVSQTTTPRTTPFWPADLSPPLLDEVPPSIAIARRPPPRLEARMSPRVTPRRCNSWASASTCNSRMSDLQGHTHGTENPFRKVDLDKVIVHVYDLFEFKRMNDVFCAVARTPIGGAFHVGVQVFEREWSYGAGRGVVWDWPLHQDQYDHRGSIHLARTQLKEWEVRIIIRDLLVDWPGSEYHWLHKNCLTFANELCARLGVGRLPSWVDRAARGASTIEPGVLVFQRSINAIREPLQEVVEKIGQSLIRNSRCCDSEDTDDKEELRTSNGQGHFLKLWDIDVVADYNFSESSAFEFTDSTMGVPPDPEFMLPKASALRSCSSFAMPSPRKSSVKIPEGDGAGIGIYSPETEAPKATKGVKKLIEM